MLINYSLFILSVIKIILKSFPRKNVSPTAYSTKKTQGDVNKIIFNLDYLVLESF